MFNCISLENQLIIRANVPGLAKKIAVQLHRVIGDSNRRPIKDLSYFKRPSLMNRQHHHQRLSMNLLSIIADINFTESDVVISSYPNTYPDWDEMISYLAHYISSHSFPSETGKNIPENHDTTIVIPTSYDGPDLDEVAHFLGLSVSDFIYWHSSQIWNVAFMGFMPGFAYLRTEHHVEIPRKASPRAAIPAGSVACGGPYCGIYPQESPGGWQIIGSTSLSLWNIHAQPPNVLSHDSHVRFHAL